MRSGKPARGRRKAVSPNSPRSSKIRQDSIGDEILSEWKARPRSLGPGFSIKATLCSRRHVPACGTNMDPKESGAAGEDSASSEPAAKVPLTPRKAAVPSSSGEVADSGLRQLSPSRNEAVWDRKNRIRPKSPKIPFDHPPKIADATGTPQKTAPLPRHPARRGFLAFFRSRRKGRSRIWNLILLPAAALIAALVIFFLLKYH